MALKFFVISFYSAQTASKVKSKKEIKCSENWFSRPQVGSDVKNCAINETFKSKKALELKNLKKVLLLFMQKQIIVTHTSNDVINEMRKLINFMSPIAIFQIQKLTCLLYPESENN